MSARRVVFRFCLLLVLVCLFSLSSLALAQTPAPVQVGQNAIGELTADASTASYTFSAPGGEAVSIQVLALSPNFIPRFRILNPSGVEILAAANPDALTSLTANASFPDPGIYTIEVSGKNGSFGQFVLSIQPGSSLPEPIELLTDQLVSAVVGSAAPLQVYHFNTTAETTSLSIRSQSPDAGVLVSLFDETANKTILSSDAGIRSAVYQLAAEVRSYRLEIRASASPDDTPYTICFGVCGSNGLANAAGNILAVNETPEVAASNCTVASATGGTVNVRGGAGTQFSIIGNLAAGQSYPALGRLADGSWVQVSVNGQIGWVAASVTRLEGDCAALPVVAAPTNAALAPTLPPAPTNPPPPPSGGGTSPTATTMPTTAPTTVPPPAVTLPDISVSISYAVLLADGRVDIGYSITVRDVTTPVSYRIRICADDSCVFENGYAATSLSSGTAKTFELTLDPLRVTHRATIMVDSDSTVAESDESNNVGTFTFQ